MLNSNGYWLVELIEEPRVHAYGPTLAKARAHIRDATALWFEVAPDAFILSEDIRLPKPVQATVDRARKERAKAQAVQVAAAGATQKAARALVEEGRLSVRDAADVLGLSHQRVQQLLAS
jgi:predicted RNase H-like HicB family nuclease